MSSDPLAPYASWYNPNSPIFVKIPAQVSTLAVSSLTGNTLNVNSTFTKNLYADYSETTEAFIYDKLTIDNQVLTADEDQLFLNGVPIATTANLSSIADWSLYAQTSTVFGNRQSTIGLSYLSASTIGAQNLTASNIFTQNLMAFNIVNFTSTVVDVYESTIQSDIKLANISTANIKNLYASTTSVSTLNSVNASFSNLSAGTSYINSLTGGTASFSTLTASSITVSSIISPPVTSGTFSTITVLSNTNTGSLTVGSNNVTTFAGTTTFNAGATFNTNEGTFNAGIGTTNVNTGGLSVTGTSYFNNQTICNLQTVSNSNTSINLIVDASTNTGTYPTINLTSKFGGGGVVNITADSPSVFVLVPSQSVNIRAKGGVGYVTGIPVGGVINLNADAGTSNSVTPTGVLANGAIKLTANSFINGAYTVPGLILESAGSIASYSGLTAPSLGVFGCGFYSALTTLSLTCGASPATTSFPGVVYLRGDNGTKVVNGFYVDTINNNVGYDLNIRSKTIDLSNRNINIDSAFDLKLNSSNGGQVYINGTPITGSGTWISTATSRLNMNSYPITDTTGRLNLSSSQVYVDATGVAPYAVITAGDPFSSLQNGQIILQTKNNSAYSKVIDSAGAGYIQTQAVSTQNFVSTSWFSGDVRVSSLNGQAVSGGGGSWVGTATSPLNMNGNGIGDNTGTLMVSTAGTVSVYTNSNIVLGVGASPTYTSQVFTSTNVDIYQVGGAGALTTHIAGNLVDIVSGNIQTQATSTINTVPATWFSGDVRTNTFTQRLISSDIRQPVIQTGFVSSTGVSGSVTITMPQRYTTQQSYTTFANMIDSPPAQIFTSSITRGSFILGWTSAGAGTQTFNWMTVGT